MVKTRIAAIAALAGLGALLATSASTPKKFSSFDPQANALLAKMTLDEKVGQMTQPDQLFLKSDQDIAKYFLGSVLSGGDSDPKEGNSLEAWTNLVDKYQKRSLETRLSIPILYGVDSVHGHNNVLGAVQFPQNIGLGCTRNPGLIEKIERITAEEVRATGINWGFAPCVTVPRDIRWGRTYEGYSDEPNGVKDLGAALSAVSKASISPAVCPSWPAPSTTSAMAAPPTAPAPSAHTCSIRAIRALTKRRSAKSICRATSPPCARASAPLCPPTAVGTASRCPLTNTCSPTF